MNQNLDAVPTYRGSPAPTATLRIQQQQPQQQAAIVVPPAAIEHFQVPAAENTTGPLPEPIVSDSLSWFRGFGVFLMAVVGIFFAVFHFSNDAGEEYEKSTMALLLRKGGLDNINVQQKIKEVLSQKNLDRVMPNAIAQRDFSAIKENASAMTENARNMVKDLVARFNAKSPEIKPLIDTDALSDVPLLDSPLAEQAEQPKFIPSGRSLNATALAGSGRSQRRSHSADYRVVSPGADQKIFSHRGFVA